MDIATKERIAVAIPEYLATKGISQKHFSKTIGVSDALISQIKNRNWDNIAFEKWRLVASAIGLELSDWQTADIDNYKIVKAVCFQCQGISIAKMITFDAGHGKTFALKSYANTEKNVYYVQCERFFTKRVFLQELAQGMGLEVEKTNIELIKSIGNFIKTKNKPLIILDEYDKIADKNGVFDLFKTFYDVTLDVCGWVLCGTKSLSKIIDNNLKKNKVSYAEVFSRVGREYVMLKSISTKDIKSIMKANLIAENYYDNIRLKLGETGDLRTLKRIIIDIKTFEKV